MGSKTPEDVSVVPEIKSKSISTKQLLPLHLRSDAEIIAHLEAFQPVTDSQKNVWAFYDKGLSKSPAWNQRNIINWVRRLDPSWTVRVLDRVEGSPVNVSQFVDDSFFPEAFNRYNMSGTYAGPHAADLVRLPLLYLYGGVWLDVTFILFGDLDNICWKELENAETEFEMAGFRVEFAGEKSMMFNSFIAARRENPCIKHWHDVFVKLWEGKTTTSGMFNHPLIRHLPEYRPNTGTLFDYQKYIDYIIQMVCLERLRHMKDPSTGWDGPNYFENKVLLFDASREFFWAQRLTRMDGQKQFDLLSTRRDGVAQDENWKEAEAFVEGILANSCLMKVFHGVPTPGKIPLSQLWDKPENNAADNEPGTFGAYLRKLSVEARPTRVPVRVSMPVFEPAILVGGITEVEGESFLAN